MKNMYVKEIIESARNGVTKVFFDMDGVLVRIGRFASDISKVDVQERTPIKSMIKTAKQLHRGGVAVGILGLVVNANHEQEMLDWIGTHMRFIKNENVVFRVAGDFYNVNKFSLKPEMLVERMTEGETIYYIDDSPDALHGMVKAIPSVKCIHVSGFVK